MDVTTIHDNPGGRGQRKAKIRTLCIHVMNERGDYFRFVPAAERAENPFMTTKSTATAETLAFADATSLAGLVRSREKSAEEVLDHYLRRVERFNPALNAVILLRAEEARHQARRIDAAIAKGDPVGPLAGVPMTIKESIDWVGTPATRGSPVYRENFPQTDAVMVQRLKAAGAVIFGKTNVPLMLQDWQSYNVIYGTTNNPWDVTRGPGGSSGGSAAALAAGLTGLELGSDIGASIRNPAHYCGVFGHKPTYGIVPWQVAQLPGSHAPSDLVAFGPLARSARDLDLALGVIAGPTGLDAEGWSLTLPPPRKRALGEFRVAVMLENDCCAQDRVLTEKLAQAMSALAAAGLRVDFEARPSVDWRRAHHIYLMLLRSATGARVSDDVFARHLESAARRSSDDHSYRAYLDRAVIISHRDWWNLHNEREGMRLRWAEFFRDYDLLLCPTAASTAMPHDQEGERPERTIAVNGKREPTTDQLFWAGLPIMTNLPATAAPVGLAADGLPCGIQIIGPHLQDRTCIEFARLIEITLGGFSPPPGYA
jgi:amidase